MKENIDLISVITGGVAAFLKGIKKKFNLKIMIVSIVVGCFLGYGSIGLLSYFLKDAGIHLTVISSFAVGWLSNEITDIIEEAAKDSYDFAKEYARLKVNRRKSRKNNEHEED